MERHSKRTILCLPRLTPLPLLLLRPTQRPLRHRWWEYVIQHPLSLMLHQPPVIEYIAPAPVMTYVAFSQQLLPAYTTTTDTTDDNFDTTDLVHTQFFPELLWRLVHHRSLFHFPLIKSFLRLCITKSVRRLRTLRKSLLRKNR